MDDFAGLIPTPDDLTRADEADTAEWLGNVVRHVAERLNGSRYELVTGKVVELKEDDAGISGRKGHDLWKSRHGEVVKLLESRGYKVDISVVVAPPPAGVKLSVPDIKPSLADIQEVTLKVSFKK